MGATTSITDDAKNREVPLSLLKSCMEFYGSLNLTFDEYHAYENFQISKPSYVNFTLTGGGSTSFVATSCAMYENVSIINRDILKITHYDPKNSVILTDEDYKLFVSAKNRCSKMH